MTCPDCSAHTPAGAGTCTACGFPLRLRPPALLAALIFGALIGLLVLAAIGVGHLLGAEPLIV
jgi:hypothetical protein